jgi:plasmid stabilization system protein ParE
MAFEIEWSDAALDHLEEIIYYLTEEAGSLTATKILDKITHRIDLLATYPEIGQREPLYGDRPEGFRRLIEGRYKIVYFISGNVVKISLIFDTRRNPDTLRALIKN